MPSISELLKRDDIKALRAAIKKDYPNILDSALDLLLWAYDDDPKAFTRLAQAEHDAAKKLRGKAPPPSPAPEAADVSRVLNSVCVYASVDDLPPAVPCKYADGVAAPALIEETE